MNFLRCFAAASAACICAVSYGQAVNIQVSFLGARKPISPLIYGASYADQTQAGLLNLPLNRSGGNATTRYNWQQNATSSASDWYFLTHEESGTNPGQSVDEWITANNNSGVPQKTKSMVTIPCMGWVAKLGPNRAWTWSFSVIKYGPQQSTEPWHPDAGNGVHTNGTNVTGNDPNDANMPVPISYQQGWLQHIVSLFGNASQNGVPYYLLDNEPALWHETHRDVFPNGVTMDGLFSRERDAAYLIKSVDPSAKVCGPEEWGWLGYLHSGADNQWAPNHGWQYPGPDKQAHGGMDVAPWLLQKFKQEETIAGRRLLDVFTLHYYPQGSYGWGDTSVNAQLWRNRSTRSLCDPNYRDESWINEKINLIPRMKNWVQAQYPGTQIGITEYNWGADDHISGALAQADVLGIFGREGVDLANRWTCPATNSMAFNAMKMYRNFDGQNGTFGDVSLPCTFPNPDELAAFASLDSVHRQLKVMLVNKKMGAPTDINITFVAARFPPPAIVYQLTSSNQIVRKPDVTFLFNSIPLTLPAQSITLLIVNQP